jgi:hypothetical protein
VMQRLQPAMERVEAAKELKPPALPPATLAPAAEPTPAPER